MPTYDRSGRFRRDWNRLSEAQRVHLKAARDDFIADLREMEAGRRSSFRPGLRVKGVKGAPGVFEMAWAPDGRATFSWGDEIVPGQRHVIWRRCGTHDIFDSP